MTDAEILAAALALESQGLKLERRSVRRIGPFRVLLPSLRHRALRPRAWYVGKANRPPCEPTP